MGFFSLRRERARCCPFWGAISRVNSNVADYCDRMGVFQDFQLSENRLHLPSVKILDLMLSYSLTDTLEYHYQVTANSPTFHSKFTWDLDASDLRVGENAQGGPLAHSLILQATQHRSYRKLIIAID